MRYQLVNKLLALSIAQNIFQLSLVFVKFWAGVENSPEIVFWALKCASFSFKDRNLFGPVCSRCRGCSVQWVGAAARFGPALARLQGDVAAVLKVVPVSTVRGWRPTITLITGKEAFSFLMLCSVSCFQQQPFSRARLYFKEVLIEIMSS